MSHSSPHQLHERVLTLTIALYRVTDHFPKAEVLRNHLRSKANDIFAQITEYRNSANNINAEIETLIQKIRTVKGYLCIAGTLNYVRSVNFTILEKEYTLIEQFLQNEKVELIKQQIGEDIKILSQAHILHPSPTMRPDAEDKRKEEMHGKLGSGVGYLAQRMGESMKEGGETGYALHRFNEKNSEGLNERQKVIMDYLHKSGHAKISDFYLSFNGVSSKTIQRDLQYLVDRRVLKKEGEKRWTVYSLSSA